MSQYVINIGALPNDGTGDPLRTAFNEVNLNFANVWNAGPVGSNIAIANNSILTTNTNGNLILNPNGIGNVVANAHVVPDQTRIRNLGAPLLRWNNLYTQYFNTVTGVFTGNVSVAGNLSVAGNVVTVNYSNANIANLTLTLAAGANSSAVANNAGIVVAGANASLLYNDSLVSWTTNLPLVVGGNVTANQFIGDGSLLTNVTATGNAETLTGTFLNANVVSANLSAVGTLANLSVLGAVAAAEFGGIFVGDGGNLSNIQGSNVAGNVATSFYANVANLALLANVATFANAAANADNAIYAVVANRANLAQVANTVSTNAQPNITSVGTMTYLSVAGNIYTGNILTDHYLWANGVPVSFGPGGNTYPAGSNTYVQYNDNGLFGGSAGFTFDKGNNTLAVANTINAPVLSGATLAVTTATIYGNAAIANVQAGNVYALNGVVFNNKIISGNFTLAGFNASSVGPVETAAGVVIDIIDGDWLIS